MRLILNNAGLHLVRGEGDPPVLSRDGMTHEPGAGIGSGWTDDQWSLAWLADAFVLGDWGIEPRLPSAEMLTLWREHVVDAEGQLRPRDYQRLIVMMLVAEGNYFEYEDETGLHPMPRPSEIKRSPQTRMPVEYVWHINNRPAIRVDADRVWHYFLPTYPQQQMGADLFATVAEVAAERRGFLPAVIQLARLTSIMRIFHKRDAGAPFIDGDWEEDDGPLEIDWRRSGITPIGPGDEIISPSISAGPISVTDVERATGGAIGRPYGISRLQASRDASDSNYSSAKLAANSDAQAWRRYQPIVQRATQRVYQQTIQIDGVPLPPSPEWEYPVMPSVDPHRESQVDRQQIADGVVSRQMVMRRLGHDPEQVMRDIEEWQRRFPDGL